MKIDVRGLTACPGASRLAGIISALIPAVFFLTLIAALISGCGGDSPSSSGDASKPDPAPRVLTAPTLGQEPAISYAEAAREHSKQLPRGGPRPELLLQMGLLKGFWSAAVSPDGQRIAATDGEAVVIWDAVAERQIARFDHCGRVVRFSPDGQYLLLCGEGEDDLLLCSRTGRIIHLFNSPFPFISSWDGVFSPDGRYLLIGSNDRDLYTYGIVGGAEFGDEKKRGVARIWDVESGRLLRTFTLPTRQVISTVDFSPDGNLILAADRAGRITVWETESGRERLSFIAHGYDTSRWGLHLWWEREGRKAAFHPDGKRIFTAYEGSLAVWNLETGGRLHMLRRAESVIRSMAISTDGRHLIIGFDDKLILYDAFSFAEKSALDCTNPQNMSLAFSADGSCFIRSHGSWDQKSILDVRRPDEYLRLTGKLFLKPFSDAQAPYLYDAAFSPDGRWMMIGALGQVEAPSDAPNRESAIVLDLNALSIRTINFAQREARTFPRGQLVWWSPDRRLVVARGGEYGKNAVLWDIDAQEEMRSFKGHVGPVRCAAVSPDGRLMLTGDSTDGQSYLPDGTKVRYLPDGSVAPSSPADNMVILWDARTGEMLHRIEDIKVKHVAFDREGKRFFIQHGDRISIWEIGSEIRARLGAEEGEKTSITGGMWDTGARSRTRQVAQIASAGGPITATLDGRLLIATDPEAKWNAIAVDIATGKHVALLEGADRFYSDMDHIVSLDISPDGKTILTAGWREVRLWDAETFDLKTTIRSAGFDEYIGGACFSADGRRALVHSGGVTRGMIEFFDAAGGRPHATLIARKQGQEWLIITADGYFHGTEDMLRRIGWRISGQVFPLDLYEARFHRPDIVSAVLTGKDTGDLEYVPAAQAPPEARIFTEEVTGEFVRIRAVVSGSNNAKIARVGAFVDGRDLAVVQGRGIERVGGADGAEVYTFRVDFPPGKTKAVIAVVAHDEYGLQSHPAVGVIVRPGPATPAPRDLYVLAVGVSRYKNADSNLNYAHADAIALADAFQRQKGLAFREVHTRILTDEQATIASIRSGLQWIGDQARNSDMAVVHFSGHGVRTPIGGLYYVPWEADGINIETYLPWDDVARGLQRIKASPVLFFSDCCHAGAFGAERPSQIEMAAPLLRNSRVMVFSSSRGMEVSLEMGRLRHGAFTYAVISGINGGADLIPDGRITISELQTYVANLVKQLTEDRQHPHIPLIKDFDPEAVIAHVR